MKFLEVVDLARTRNFWRDLNSNRPTRIFVCSLFEIAKILCWYSMELTAVGIPLHYYVSCITVGKGYNTKFQYGITADISVHGQPWRRFSNFAYRAIRLQMQV